MAKRLKPGVDSNPTALSAQGSTKRPKGGIAAATDDKALSESNQPLLSETHKEPLKSGKTSDAAHGNRFQSKLLVLFTIRGINLGYQFSLGTELVVGVKFDDLIFYYRDDQTSSTNSSNNKEETCWKYLYLQAKHTLNENDWSKQITVKQLLDVNDCEFSLVKYFQSYVKISNRGDEIKNCIICTNVDFNNMDFEKYGIELKPVKQVAWPQILNCKTFKLHQAFYKFKVTDKLRQHIQKNCKVCKKEEIEGFFDKLLFAVNMPNEDELDQVLSQEINNYFKMPSVDFEFTYIMNELNNWFKKKDNVWLSSEIAKTLILNKTNEINAKREITTLSVDYQNTLKRNLEFNETEILDISNKLETLLLDSSKKIQIINSTTPKLSAVKVISALQKIQPDLQCKDNYWVMSLKRVQDEDILKSNLSLIKSRHLLVIVEEDGKDSTRYEYLITTDQNRQIIVISSQRFNKNEVFKDVVSYGQLTELSQQFLKSRPILFQGTNQTVNELIDIDKAEAKLDASSIDTLLQTTDQNIIEIPSFSSSQFEQSLYIKRQISFPFDNQSMFQLANKLHCSLNELNERACRVTSNGKIEWCAHDKDKKSTIWKTIKAILKNNCQSSAGSILAEDEVINRNKNRVIITGVAGTGKSTILSNFYEKIKKEKSDWWIIKLSLVDNSKALSSSTHSDENPMNSASAIEFLVNFPAIGIDQNPFSRSLLRHRLENGERIVLMMDGFDEINSHCQYIVEDLVLNLNASIPIFVTTRPHMVEELQFNLSQLAYSLVKFSKEDQIKYLSLIWKDHLNEKKAVYKESTIEQLAETLVDQVAQSLKDKERNFIGIPLQCRILAECFQTKIHEAIINNSVDYSSLFEGQNFDLCSLYRFLITTKQQVFRQDKIKLDTVENHIANDCIEMAIKQIESYMTQLAIETIINEQEDVELLCPEKFRWSQFKSEKERKEEKKKLDELSVRFGLLDKSRLIKDGDSNYQYEMQFLHRTYAEFLVADHLYKSFEQNEEGHNKLLEYYDVRQLIANEILKNDKYDGVRVFLDSMLKTISLANSRVTNNFPTHLQQLASVFVKESPLNCLLINKNTNITKFILDVLDATFVPIQVRQIINRDIMSKNTTNIFQQSSEVFQRLLSYYNDAVNKEWGKMLVVLCKDYGFKRRSLQADRYMESGTEEELKTNFELFLDFIKKNPNRFGQLAMDRNRNDIKILVVYLIYAPNWSHVFPDVVEFLSSVYSEDSMGLANLLKDVTVLYYESYRENESLSEKMDFLFRHLKNNKDQMSEISHLILKNEPETFINFYRQLKPEDEGDEFDVITGSLTETNSFGMTRLHRAVLLNYTERVEQILDNCLSKSEKNDEINNILDIMMDEKDDCTSLCFIAFAACGNEKVCLKMLEFLKEVLPADQLRGVYMNNDEGSFLHLALVKVIKNENEKNFKIITESVKKILGLDALINLLATEPRSINNSLFVNACKKGWFKNTIDIILENDGTNFYQQLNENLMYHPRYRDITTDILWALEHIETDILQKVIAVKGFDDWIKSRLETNFAKNYENVCIFSENFIQGLDEKQRSQLVLIVTSVSSDTVKSYWADYSVTNTRDSVSFMEHTSILFNENDLRKLLFHDNGWIRKLAIALVEDETYPDEVMILNGLLNRLPENLQLEFRNHLTQKIPQFIDEMLSNNQGQPIKLAHNEIFNLFNFCLAFGNHDQLSTFFRGLIQHNRIDEEDMYSSQWDYILPVPNLWLAPDINQFSQRLSDKLGENSIKEMILQDEGNDVFTIRPALMDRISDVEEYYAHLSIEKQDEIRHQVLATPGVVEDMLDKKNHDHWAKHYLGINSGRIVTNPFDGFNFLSLYFIEKINSKQLRKFLQCVLAVENVDKKNRYRSIWSDYIDKACQTHGDQLSITEKSIRNLVKYTSEKLDQSYLQRLMYHDDNGNSREVIVRAALSGTIQIIEALISQLEESEQTEIRQNSFRSLEAIANLWNINGLEYFIQVYLTEIEDSQNTVTIIKGFEMFTHYFLKIIDRNQLNEFIRQILLENPRGCTIWGGYIGQVICQANRIYCFDTYEEESFLTSVKVIKRLFKYVASYLGQTAVNDLVRHEDADGIVIQRVLNNSSLNKVVDTMLYYLSENDKNRIRHENQNAI